MPSDEPTTHESNHGPAAARTCVSQYEIRVSGHLERRWDAWFDGLDVISQDDGTTVIRGAVVDQSALHGVLAKLRDLGIPLISLLECRHDEASDLAGLRTPQSSPNPSGATQ